MNQVETIGALLLALGIGGVGGAIAATLVAGGRVRSCFEQFSCAFHQYFARRSDPESEVLKGSFSELEAALSALGAAFTRLGRSVKRR